MFFVCSFIRGPASSVTQQEGLITAKEMCVFPAVACTIRHRCEDPAPPSALLRDTAAHTMANSREQWLLFAYWTRQTCPAPPRPSQSGFHGDAWSGRGRDSERSVSCPPPVHTHLPSPSLCTMGARTDGTSRLKIPTGSQHCGRCSHALHFLPTNAHFLFRHPESLPRAG